MKRMRHINNCLHIPEKNYLTLLKNNIDKFYNEISISPGDDYNSVTSLNELKIKIIDRLKEINSNLKKGDYNSINLGEIEFNLSSMKNSRQKNIYKNCSLKFTGLISFKNSFLNEQIITVMIENHSDRKIIRKFHFDLHLGENYSCEMQNSRVHLQFGGKLKNKTNESYEYNEEEFEIPRFMSFPLPFTSILDFILREFLLHCRIIENSNWKSQVSTSEALFLKKYINLLNNNYEEDKPKTLNTFLSEIYYN